MTIHLDDTPLADDVPAADAAEQRQPVDVSAEDAGLDPRYVANLFAASTPTLRCDRPGHHRAVARRRPRRRRRRGSKHWERRGRRRHIARRDWPNPVQQVAPRGAGGDQRSIVPVPGRLILGQRHQRVSQTQRAHVMRLGGLHDLHKRLVEAAAPQRNEHTFGGVEDPRPRPTRVRRPAKRVHLALTSWTPRHSNGTTHNLCHTLHISSLLVAGPCWSRCLLRRFRTFAERSAFAIVTCAHYNPRVNAVDIRRPPPDCHWPLRLPMPSEESFGFVVGGVPSISSMYPWGSRSPVGNPRAVG